tara:strand:+ start:390 stop:512 length:123 start_codon:yes stop_codon:yes gene_type:complete
LTDENHCERNRIENEFIHVLWFLLDAKNSKKLNAKMHAIL